MLLPGLILVIKTLIHPSRDNVALTPRVAEMRARSYAHAAGAQRTKTTWTRDSRLWRLGDLALGMLLDEIPETFIR